MQSIITREGNGGVSSAGAAAFAKTRSGPYDGLEEGAELDGGGQNDETPVSLSGTAQPEVCTAATGAAARSCAETAVSDNTIGGEQVFTVQSSNHRKGVLSLYIRH